MTRRRDALARLLAALQEVAHEFAEESPVKYPWLADLWRLLPPLERARARAREDGARLPRGGRR